MADSRVDAPLATARGALARLGLDLEQATRPLQALGAWDGGSPGTAFETLVEALAAAPNPDLALPGLARVAEAAPDDWGRHLAEDTATVLRRAALLAGTSETLTSLLAAHPELLGVVAGDLEPRTAPTVRALAAAVLDGASDLDTAARALVLVQRSGLLRVALRDLLGWVDTPGASRELSDLADGILAAALDHVHPPDRDTRVAVVAMGKLGGRELNYVSDVDVVFVHDGDDAEALAAAKAMLALIGRTTPDGAAYELDPTLRPEGRDGPLSRTLAAYDGYYSRWAEHWEFQALLKARAVGGDPPLGEAFAAMATGHVWSDRLGLEGVDAIQRMKAVAESSRAVRRDGARQLKLAPGGLRDIEFAVQLLQLVHGRLDASLRGRGTLEALAALSEGGYVDEGDANLFADAYHFLRTVEHRLQLRRLRRTHTVPSDDPERRRVARAVGFRDLATRSALEQFDREFARTQGAVRRLHQRLFYRPLLGRMADFSSEDRAAVPGPEGELEPAAARRRLEALGFAAPGPALDHLHALAGGVGRSAKLLRALLPAMLEQLAESADPDGGLAALRDCDDRLSGAPAYLRLLRDAPPGAAALAGLLGASPRLGEWFARQPDVLALLADDTLLAEPRTDEDYRELAQGLVRRGAAPGGDALRRFRRREALRTAVRDLARADLSFVEGSSPPGRPVGLPAGDRRGRSDVLTVARELTALGEACLEVAVATLVPDGVRLAVVGLGRFGACELSYASDLDVLLLFEPADRRAEALAAAERLLAFLSEVTPEGQAFRVDLGLRPEGRDGPLTRTLEATLAYYERWAEHWEFQALTQARHVAGDANLGGAFLDAVATLVYRDPAPKDRLAAVRAMKARVEKERAGGGTGRRPAAPTGRLNPGAAAPRARFRPTGRLTPKTAQPEGRTAAADVKLGPGGLSDVEWTVQLLQLRHGGAIPALRAPGTLPALAAAAEHDLLAPEEAAYLRSGWLLASRVRNARWLLAADPDRLPTTPRDLDRLARLMGYGTQGRQALSEELERSLRRVRRIHERVFYGA